MMQTSAEVLDISQGGHNPQAVSGNNCGPQIWRDGDRSYLLWTSRGAGDWYPLENFVCYYDHAARRWSQSYGVGAGNAFAADIHGKGSVITAADGRIIVIHEKLRSGANNHVSDLLVKRTVAAGDIAQWELVATITGYYSYPKLWRDCAGKLFCAVRGGVSNDACRGLALCSSVDDGLTWSVPVIVVEGSDRFWLYSGRLCQSPEQGLHLFVNVYDNSFQRYPVCAYLYSRDGITWTNVDRSYSWSQPINWETEFLPACVVAQVDYSSPPYQEGAGISCGCVSPDGNPYLVTQYAQYDYQGGGQTHRIYYLTWFEDGAWQSRAIEGIVADIIVNSTTDLILHIAAYSDDAFDIMVNVNVAGVGELQQWRTLDRGLTWSKFRDITAAGEYNNYYIQGAAEPPADGRMLVAASYATGTYCDLRVAEVTLMSAPLAALCTLDDVKSRLGLTGTEHDSLIASIISGVSSIFDSFTRRTLIAPADAVTENYTGCGPQLRLRNYPVISITSIKQSVDYDFDNVDALVENTDYRLLNSGRTGIVANIAGAWYGEPPDCIELIYRAGYCAAGVTPGTGEYALPADLREAAIQQASFVFKRRDDIGISATSFQGGGMTKYSPVDLLPEVKSVVEHYRRNTL